MNSRDKESGGISETVGTIMLIGVITIVFGVFAVALFSNMGGGGVPPAVLLKSETGYNPVNEECLIISHEGGDGILRSNSVIMVNGEDRTVDFTDDQGDLWEGLNAGESLYLDLTEIEGDIESIVVISGLNRNNPTVIYMYELVQE